MLWQRRIRLQSLLRRAEVLTKLLGCGEAELTLAAELIKSGEVVGFPTETVYGLGANAFDAAAVEKIFRAKGRPADNPLIVHISSLDMIEDIAAQIPPLALKIAELFWPGPLTMIMPKSDRIPSVTSGGLDTVGIRFPSHPVAKRLIELCDVPLAAPSANLSGSPSPTTARRVFEDMSGRIPAIIDGGESAVGVESTVIAFDGDGVRILRPGGVTPQMLREVTQNVTVDEGVINELSPDAVVRSPGMKYKHYAPKAQVRLIKSDIMGYCEYVKSHAKTGDFCLVFGDDESVAGIPYLAYGQSAEMQAHELFEKLRQLDEMGARTVFARCPKADGVGLAVYNRILRAAGFCVIDLSRDGVTE